MNICDIYNRMYRKIDYMTGFKKSYDVRETNVLNIISGILFFIFSLIFMSWWMIPIRFLKNYKFKATLCIRMHKHGKVIGIKESDIDKYESNGWERF